MNAYDYKSMFSSTRHYDGELSEVKTSDLVAELSRRFSSVKVMDFSCGSGEIQHDGTYNYQRFTK